MELLYRLRKNLQKGSRWKGVENGQLFVLGGERSACCIARFCRLHDLPLRPESLARTFVKLLTGLSQKYQQKVVVLVDEYDKPIINHLGKGEEGLKIARQNRDLLKNFFGMLKGGQVAASLRFVFITGISKFSRVSIFSDLNNLQDLTVHAGYADMLGYTQEELEQYFGDRIAEFAQKQKTSADDVLQKLREWYNGYVTIQDFDGALYSLGYPNQEVKTSFLNYLYHDLVKISGTT